MGTNYYAFRKDFSSPDEGQRELPEAMRSKKGMHIGKSSAGWCFSLRVHPEEGINSLADWEALLKRHDVRIKDEYDSEIALDDLLSYITKRSSRNGVPFNQAFRPGVDAWYTSLEDFHSKNNSEEGPNGLLRHRLTGGHCVGHGEGTWDLIEGEFC